MKTMTFVLAIAAVLFAACESTEKVMDQPSSFNTSTIFETYSMTAEDCIDSSLTTTAEDLTQTDIDGLMLMREEEKLAHDVYTYFYEAYGLNIFSNISSSEERHANAVLTLINAFELEDPMQAEVGVFMNETLQGLYETLTADGATIEAALATGAFIEEYDIVDLEELIEATEIPEIEAVYANLKAGSENHLRGFVRTLANYGITYESEIISAEYFAEILAQSNGRGGSGQGIQGGQQGSQLNGQDAGNKGSQQGGRKGSGNGGNGTQGANGNDGECIAQ